MEQELINFLQSCVNSVQELNGNKKLEYLLKYLFLDLKTELLDIKCRNCISASRIDTLEKKVEELQEELRHKKRSRSLSPRSRSPKQKKQKKNERQLWCYSCGAVGHITRYCKQKKVFPKNCTFCGGSIHKTLRDCPNDPHHRPWRNDMGDMGEELGEIVKE